MKNKYCQSGSLTNESAVERLFVDRLLEDLGYADEDIRTKTSLKEFKVGRGSKSDLYKPDYVLSIKNVPVAIIDAKNSHEDLNKWTSQCSSYCLELNKKFSYHPVQYFALTNGLQTLIHKWDRDEPILALSFEDFLDGNSKFEELTSLLSKTSLMNQIHKSKAPIEKSAFPFSKIPLIELSTKFQKLHNYIWKKEKKAPSAVFEELIKVVFVKIRKDRELHEKLGSAPNPTFKDVVFSTFWLENQTQSDNPLNDILFHNLIKELELEIKKSAKKRIFEENDNINLAPDTIKRIVEELEHVDLFAMEEDIHGRMFESFLEATARGEELGQFFTTRDVVNLMVLLADIPVSKSEVATVLDACCGSGGFLIAAMIDMIKKANAIVGISKLERSKLISKIKNESICGIDAGSDPKIYRIARMNMYLHGDGGSNIFFADSLDKRIGEIGKPSLEYQLEIKEIRTKLIEKKERFDVILSNPPFSMQYDRSDDEQEEIMEQYEVGSIGGKKSKTLLSSVMFLERYKELVKPDGKIFAIIDDSVLSGDSYSGVRSFIRSSFIIEAVISLPGDAFRRSEARVKTSVLILRLKKQGEDQPEIFMDMAVRIGLEQKIAKRIGAMTVDLEKTKHEEIERIATAFKSFKAGKTGNQVVSPDKVKDRLDAKYYISHNGRKTSLWQKNAYTPVKVKSVLSQALDRGELVDRDGVYQFLQVNYQGEVVEGDSKLGMDCSYRELFVVRSWDILMSNMGVGRGAIGIVPPYHEGKYVSTEYSILRAKSKEEAIYYTGILKTKEILGDILTTTTGMNRGRITWENIQEIDIPKFQLSNTESKNLVSALEKYWDSYMNFHDNRSLYFSILSTELGLDELDAQERWLALKPPE